jgi:hypothetical protein
MMNNKNILNLLLIIIFTALLAQCRDSRTRGRESVSPGPGIEERDNDQRTQPKLVHDERGNVVERHVNAYRPSDGSLRSVDSYYYQYDDQDNVIKEVKESHEPGGTLKYRNVNYYTYNEENLLKEIRFESYNAGNKLERKARNTFQYNKAGQKIEDIGYYDDGTIKSRIILDYDEKGVLRSEEYIDFNEKGSKVSHKKYYYSQSGLEKTVDMMDK